MKKTLLGLAILGASAAAAAQTSVTIYGIVDVGFVSQRGIPLNGTTEQTSNELRSGNQSGSRLGFKGTEDLGRGMKANFIIENGFNVDNGTAAQGGLLLGRRATVGLSGDFGAVDLGRRNSPFYNAIDSVDPMSTGFAGNAANMMYRNGNAGDVGQRMNNAVFYTTPQFGPISAELAYGFGEVAGDNSANRIYGGSVAYVDGPISVALAHHNVNNGAGNTNSKNTVITGKYKFAALGAHLAYAQNSGAAVDSNDLLVGVSVPFGPHTFLASYIQKNDDSAAQNDAKQYAIAYTYALSTRTNFYASYAKITNDNAANFKTNGAFGDREANFGIRHKF